MRAIRTAQVMAAALVLVISTATAALSTTYGQETPAVKGIVGTVELDPTASLGGWSMVESVHQYRDIPVSGDQIFADDARLKGRLDAILNYDVHASGKEPVPAWGTMSIDDGAWTGTFTGIRRGDYEPFDLRAFLVGTGEFEGLCAVLDIKAASTYWAMDGVIHPLPMGA